MDVPEQKKKGEGGQDSKLGGMKNADWFLAGRLNGRNFGLLREGSSWLLSLLCEMVWGW